MRIKPRLKKDIPEDVRKHYGSFPSACVGKIYEVESGPHPSPNGYNEVNVQLRNGQSITFCEGEYDIVGEVFLKDIYE